MTSLDDVTRTVGHLYDAAGEPERWPAALRSVADLLKASASVLAFQDETRQFPVIYSVGVPPEAMRAYFDPRRTDARVLAGVRKAPIGAYTDSMMVPRKQLLRSEYMQTWGIPYGTVKCVQAFAFQQLDCAGFIGAARPLRGNDFEIEQVELIALLLPHVERAIKIQLRLHRACITEMSAVQSLEQLPQAVLLVNKKARVFFANSVAQAMLRASDGIGVNADGLYATTPASTLNLRRMVAAAAHRIEVGTSKSHPAVLLLERHAERAPLSAIIAPLRPRDSFPWIPGIEPEVLVVITDPERRSAELQNRLMSMHGLTRTETAVATLVAEGRGVKATAEILKVAPSTVRTHLHRVFSKTRTARQAELAAFILQSGLT